MRASSAVIEMRTDLTDARVLHGREHRVLVLDPPESVGGLDAVRPALPWMLDPAFSAEGSDPAQSDAVRALEFRGFRMLTREREFEELRVSGVIVVFPSELLVGDEPGARQSHLIGPSASSTGSRLWRGDGRSPDVDLEALSLRTVRARALPDLDSDMSPRLGWRARSPLCERGKLTGVWVMGEDGREAVFDVESSLCWLLASRIRRVWFEEPLTRVVSAEVLEAPLSLATNGAPEAADGDWIFSVDEASVPHPAYGEARWSVEFLDLHNYVRVELPALRDGARVRVEGASDVVAGLIGNGGGPVAWALEVRVDDTTLARTRGRRIGLAGEPPVEGGVPPDEFGEEESGQ